MIGGASPLINATLKMGGGETALWFRLTKLQVSQEVNYRWSPLLSIPPQLQSWPAESFLSSLQTSSEVTVDWQTKESPSTHVVLTCIKSWSLQASLINKDLDIKNISTDFRRTTKFCDNINLFLVLHVTIGIVFSILITFLNILWW